MSPSLTETTTTATGPRTPEGKARSSMNALRHGLTARLVVLPTEDLAAYQQFSEEIVASLHPETPIERQFAQSVADLQWRLNRARTLEDGILGLGHFEPAGEIDPGHPEIHAALTSARVFRGESQTFVNLSLYEQRLHRALKDALKHLRDLQTERLARRQRELEEAKALRNLNKMQHLPYDPQADGFVFSTAEVDSAAHLDFRLEAAHRARLCNFDYTKFRQTTRLPARMTPNPGNPT